MSLSTSSEFFINMKSIPDPTSLEYNAFFENERDKIEKGLTINGVYIPGWLYWHTNHWKMYFDSEDGSRQKRISLLRDNEWLLANTLIEAKKQRKGVIAIGGRQLGKSEVESSIIGRSATIFEGSQNIISAGNERDLLGICRKIDLGLNELNPYFKWSRIESDWRKQVTLGIKDKQGNRIPWSIILPRNLDDGNNTEAVAGVTATEFVLDEALKEDSLLYKENGEIKIKDCQVDDKIFNHNGNLVSIIKKVDVGIKPIYKITLRDRREINACADHLWTVWDNVLKKEITINTNHLIKLGFSSQVDSRYTNKSNVLKCRFAIKNNSPVEYKERDLKVDPYYMGLWLGDGDKSNTAICNIDQEIIDYIKEYTNKLGLTYKHEPKNFVHGSYVKQGEINPLREQLRYYNVFKNKHIPNDFHYNSFENRLALLQGLMDTDGTCTSIGALEFVSVKEELASGFYKLCRSLGISIKSRIVYNTFTHKGEKKIGKKTWRFTLATDLPIFRLSRKLANYNKSSNKKMLSYKEKTYIKSIELIGNYQAYCIQVDSEDGLFLTDNYTVTHNCGKFPFLRCLEAAIPAFVSPYGWRCTPLLIGTGGAFDKGADAEKIYHNPESYNFLAIEAKEESKKYGLFLPGTYRMDGKKNVKLGEWLKEDKKIEISEDSELYNLNFQATDESKALEIIQKEREVAKKANDQEAYLKAVMYYPLTPAECFLTTSYNIFNSYSAKAQQQRIYDDHIEGSFCFFEYNGEKIIKVATDKTPVSRFPHNQGDNKDSPVVIWEDPIKDPPFGLYVAGIDPYRFASSKYSDSLGAVYIYKRMHDIASEKFQNTFVAAYVARPESKDKWEEQARLLIKYYNARSLCENDEMSFIEYMKAKGDAHYLEKQPPWLKEIVPNTTVTRDYGIHRSSQRIIDYLNGCMKTYLNEKLYEEKDENGSIIKEVLGVYQIRDAMLLEEISKFNDTGNFDRIVAASLAIAMANHLDPIMGKMSDTEEDPRFKSLFDKTKNKMTNLFGQNNSRSRNKIFK